MSNIFIFPITYFSIIIWIILTLGLKDYKTNATAQFFGLALGLSLAFENEWLEIINTTTQTYSYTGANINTIITTQTLSNSIVNITSPFDYVVSLAIIGISCICMYLGYRSYKSVNG